MHLNIAKTGRVQDHSNENPVIQTASQFLPWTL